jgi:hypothetical protein
VAEGPDEDHRLWLRGLLDGREALATPEEWLLARLDSNQD